MKERAPDTGSQTARTDHELREPLAEAEVARVLGSGDVEAMPWRLVSPDGSVREKTLREDGISYVGLLEMAPGAELDRHFRPGVTHHLYVLSGTCELKGSLRVIESGSYVYGPGETLHGMKAVGPEGCRVFYLQASMH